MQLALLRPAITALAAGNTCILKVSDAPNTGKMLVGLAPQYFAPEALVALTGGPTEIAELLRLPFDFIFFAGSVRVAKIVLRAAAENITPVLLELGGQNPAIVDQSANVPDAAKKIVWEPRHGAVSGALRLGTHMFTRRWQISLLRSAVRP
jgi:aldehyde dehydrogenase (NAD+)